ncbi:MAG: hypothetical protein ABI581_14435 [Sediminibacterium sp.]
MKGNIDGSPDVDPKSIRNHKYVFDVGIGINPEEKIVGLQLEIRITATGIGGKDLNVTGAYTHDIVFRVENLDDFVEISADETEPPEIDALMSATLTGIAFSTVRGIIFSRTQGTSLGTVILPVIDPKKLAAFSQLQETGMDAFVK